MPFPLPSRTGVSLVDGDGHERAWIDRLAESPRPQRQLVEEELASREFVLEVAASGGTFSSFATPAHWVDTDRGPSPGVAGGRHPPPIV